MASLGFNLLKNKTTTSHPPPHENANTQMSESINSPFKGNMTLQIYILSLLSELSDELNV